VSLGFFPEFPVADIEWLCVGEGSDECFFAFKASE
jgi:hypothetical protein